MVTTILIIIVVAIFAFYMYKLFHNETLTSKQENATLTKYIVLGVFGVIAAVIQPFTIERVDAGHVGIKVMLTGDDRGVSKYEYKTGWVIYNTWISQLYEFPTFQQHVDFPEQIVITKGGFPTTIKPSFNYNLIPGNIGDMFQNLRIPLKDIQDQWLYNAIISSVNDISNTWTVDDIFNNREKFEASIIAEACKRTKKWFVISQLRTNIIPPDALKESITSGVYF